MNSDSRGPTAQVKEESTGISLDNLPFGERVDTPESRKITELKQHEDVKSGALSSERSSPAATMTIKKNNSKKKGASNKKKPTTVGKNRKLADIQDGGSVEASSRSNTPQSSRASKTPAPKSNKSKKAPTSSPAPSREKKKGGKKGKDVPDEARSSVVDVQVEGQAEGQTEGQEDEDDDASEPGEVFCICRKPDNHTWMIGCDGDCEDWFHGKCVDIDSKDAELIERYICRLISFYWITMQTNYRRKVRTAANLDMGSQLGNQCVGYLAVVNRLAWRERTRASTAPMNMEENSCVRTYGISRGRS